MNPPPNIYIMGAGAEGTVVEAVEVEVGFPSVTASLNKNKNKKNFVSAK